MTRINYSSSLQLFTHLLFLFAISFPSPFSHPKKVSQISSRENAMRFEQLCHGDTMRCQLKDEDKILGILFLQNWATISGVNGQLNGLGGGIGTSCTDFEPNCGAFRRFCFLQSIAEACLFSCGICGGFGGIGGGVGFGGIGGGVGGPFGKKK